MYKLIAFRLNRSLDTETQMQMQEAASPRVLRSGQRIR